MSKNLLVLTTEYTSFLTGSLVMNENENLKNFQKQIIPVYVVIVDDNSGSMSGGRAINCVLKTQAIIRECVAKGVSYQYAT